MYCYTCRAEGKQTVHHILPQKYFSKNDCVVELCNKCHIELEGIIQKLIIPNVEHFNKIKLGFLIPYKNTKKQSAADSIFNSYTKGNVIKRLYVLMLYFNIKEVDDILRLSYAHIEEMFLNPDFWILTNSIIFKQLQRKYLP